MIMAPPLKKAVALTVAVLAGRAAAAQDTPVPDRRKDLATLERVLEGAVRQVSRASPAHALAGAGGCRSYALDGYGAVFVLAPRLLPLRSRGAFPSLPGFEMNEAMLEQALRATEAQLGRVSSPEMRLHIQQRLDAMRRTLALLKARHEEEQQAQASSARAEKAARQAAQRARPRPSRPRTDGESREAEIRVLEEQALAFEREAEQAREEAEHAILLMAREVQDRLPPAEPPLPPGVASVQTPPAPPVAPLPPPPWRTWFEGEEDTGRTPESVVHDVRSAVTNVLEAHGSELRLLQPEEFIVVAVDFFPRGSFGPWERPQRTLIVRVKKKELTLRRAGKIPAEELRKRIEYLEY